MKQNIARRYRVEWTLIAGHHLTIVSNTEYVWGERLHTVQIGNCAGYVSTTTTDAARLMRNARDDKDMTVTRIV